MNRRGKTLWAVVAAAAMAGGCNTIPGDGGPADATPTSVASIAPLPAVMNRLKCDLAIFVASHRDASERRLKVNAVDGDLVFNLSRSKDAGATFGLAVAPPGAKISFGAGGQQSENETYTTTLHVHMDGHTAPTVACEQAKPMLKVHIIDLGGLATQIDAVTGGTPKIETSKVTFEGKFYLKQSATLSGGLEVVFLKISDAKASSASEFVQSFKLDVDTKGTVALYGN
ncbi:MAG: hypothetical protein JWP73_97 [Phenylobacterium sp.]|nr:hypothetical protein [Phenylobacterium sp.]